MPEEQDNQIERRVPSGINRRSETARRGSDAASFVRGLATKPVSERKVAATTLEYSFRFLRKWGGYGKGNGQFSAPWGLAIGSDRNVYVLDMGNDRIQVFDLEGRFLRKWGTQGMGDGEFDNPRGLAFGPNGNLHVADRSNHRIQVFDLEGRFLRKWGTRGTGDGELRFPRGAAIDGDGNVYVPDAINNRIQVFECLTTASRSSH